MPAPSIKETERYFASNLILLDWRRFNLVAPAKFCSFARNDYASCVTHVEWQKLYRKYVDPAVSVSRCDDVRWRIRKKMVLVYCCKLLARCVALPFRGESRRVLRQNIRERVISFLLNHVKFV
ncbi:MAG: hypothetical protein LBB60_04585 [Desulfovibrio sp.]|jgi:hypothetical protein|nr:hypothetical protein [Desulfovibrio sp.]